MSKLIVERPYRKVTLTPDMVRKADYINIGIIVRHEVYGVVEPVVYLGKDDGEYIEQIRDLLARYLEDPNVDRVIDSTVKVYE